MSIGPLEFVVVALIALALFGPALIGFWLGYVTGRKSVTPSGTPPIEAPQAPEVSPPTTPAPDEETHADD